MISDRDANLGIKSRVPFVEGSILVTKTRGKTPEMVLVERVLEGGVGMVNLADGRPFKASLDSLTKGRVGRSEVVGGSSKAVDSRGGRRDYDSFQCELGTDMFIVTPKEGKKEETLTFLSGTDSDNAILSTPERPDKQMLRIPKEDLLKGESDSLLFTPVPPKFSLLKEAHLLNHQPALREALVDEGPVVKGPEGVISRDVETAEVIGDSLPRRTIEEILDDPNAVFLKGMKMAAVAMVKNGDARNLAALIALNSGVFARLPILHNSA